MDKSALLECFDLLSSEAKELYLDSEVPALDHIPTPLEFYREWVSPNKPVVIHGVLEGWSALTNWTNQYLRDTVGGKEVSVAVTPNGYADAVYKDRFVMPEERRMNFTSFLDIIEGRGRKDGGIFYIQKQNSNFTEEFQDLMAEAAEDIPWASQAFGKQPDAVNFWMGESEAVTSLHKDHYENLYCVVRGHKTFTLLPPSDQPFIPYEDYQAAHYKQQGSGQFDIIDDHKTGKVPWIPVDPLHPDHGRYPKFIKTHPVTVTVHAGETLYLPSLWYHHVQQSHGCIAVNYWYDMEFDIRYNYFHFVEELLKSQKKICGS